LHLIIYNQLLLFSTLLEKIRAMIHVYILYHGQVWKKCANKSSFR